VAEGLFAMLGNHRPAATEGHAMTNVGPVGVGVIGAGMISEFYLENLTRFPDTNVLAIADIDLGRAQASADKWKLPYAGTTEELLANPDVEIVLNLTIPAAHASVSTAAVEAGKHVWSEKPITVDRESARSLVDLARQRGLLLGVAPDTLLGRGWQTGMRAIRSGAIGTPQTAVTSFQWQGPDWFHVNPEFLFAQGGGPVFDMGPYYFSALVHLLGPIAKVAATGRTGMSKRLIRQGPRAGTEFPVDVFTHVSILTEFEQGGAAQTLLSFDTSLFRHGVFEINGTEGTIFLPDPNRFDGEIRIARPLEKFERPIQQQWETIEPLGAEAGRGLGVLDMARHIRTGGSHIAIGDLGLHVLDTLIAVEESATRGEFIPIESTVAAPSSLPEEFDPFEATL
jgi:predicted dehydrogenase